MSEAWLLLAWCGAEPGEGSTARHRHTSADEMESNKMLATPLPCPALLRTQPGGPHPTLLLLAQHSTAAKNGSLQFSNSISWRY